MVRPLVEFSAAIVTAIANLDEQDTQFAAARLRLCLLAPCFANVLAGAWRAREGIAEELNDGGSAVVVVVPSVHKVHRIDLVVDRHWHPSRRGDIGKGRRQLRGRG